MICIGFEENNVKVFPMIETSNFEQPDDPESSTAAAKAKKRPLRKFDDHLGCVPFVLFFFFKVKDLRLNSIFCS